MHRKWIGAVLATAFLVVKGLAADQVFLDPERFIAQNFTGRPEREVLWLNAELRDSVANILGHPYRGMRISYWRQGSRTAWILDEIGKVQPITAGFVIEGGILQEMAVLIYRENRGWEVRYPFFTRQFRGLSLKKGDKLDREIDGISGATLSVDALVRMSEMALFLDREVRK